MKLKVIDVLTLNNILKYKVSVDQPSKKITGGQISCTPGGYENEPYSSRQIRTSINTLENNDFIQRSDFAQSLTSATIATLKNALKKGGYPYEGTKDSLIQLILQYELSIPNLKYFFIITEKGCDILKKYANVTWINKNYHALYQHPYDTNDSSPLSETYFIDKLDVNITNELIKYYIDKNLNVVSTVYYLEEDYYNSFKFRVLALAKNFNARIHLIKTDYSRYRQDNYYLEYCNRELSKLVQFIQVSNEDLEKLLVTAYDESLSDDISFEEYCHTLIPLIQNDGTFNRSEFFNTLENIYSIYEKNSEDDRIEIDKEYNVNDLLGELFNLTSQWLSIYSKISNEIGDKPLGLLKEMIKDGIAPD